VNKRGEGRRVPVRGGPSKPPGKGHKNKALLLPEAENREMSHRGWGDPGSGVRVRKGKKVKGKKEG